MGGRTKPPEVASRLSKHVVRRQQWREATTRYRAKLRAQVDALLPPEPCFRCHVYGEATELAHIKPTGVNGRGRGCGQRLRDVLKNPTHFVRLCVPCHRGFDSGKLDLELEPAPF